MQEPSVFATLNAVNCNQHTEKKGNLTYPVIGIGPNVFRGNKTLKTISLPNTIRVIETGAFAYCNAMIDH